MSLIFNIYYKDKFLAALITEERSENVRELYAYKTLLGSLSGHIPTNEVSLALCLMKNIRKIVYESADLKLQERLHVAGIQPGGRKGILLFSPAHGEVGKVRNIDVSSRLVRLVPRLVKGDAEEMEKLKKWPYELYRLEMNFTTFSEFAEHLLSDFENGKLDRFYSFKTKQGYYIMQVV